MGGKKKKQYRYRQNMISSWKYYFKNRFDLNSGKLYKDPVIYNTKDHQFKRHDKDCGSPEVQISRLTSRINQLTVHLQEHKHDYSTKRGLMMIIGKRIGLLRYLVRHDSQKYLNVCEELGIKKSIIKTRS